MQVLPGREAHRNMIPVARLSDIDTEPPPDAVSSAVLVLLYPIGDEIHTAVILRSEYDGVHSGQISLPGGRWEPTDKDVVETALREAQEEVGIQREQLTLIGSLSKLYISRSNFLVFPAVAFCMERPDFKADPVEVQEVIEIKLQALLDPETKIQKTLQLSQSFSMDVPGFLVEGHFIWGATAMIFSELISVIKSM